MVSVVFAAIAFLLGLTTAVGIPFAAPLLSTRLQRKIGDHWYGMAMKSFGPSALVWREYGNPEIKPFEMDDSYHIAQATLTSGTLSDDEKLPFKDPDNRINRWKRKPFAIVPELLPAAVDAELAEAGHWRNEKRMDEGLISGDEYDPLVPWSTDLRAVDPKDAFHMATKGVDPENVKTAEELTEARYSEYGTGLGVKEEATILISFAAGAGVVVGAAYIREEVIGGGSDGGTGTSVNIPPGVIDITPDVLAVIGGLL